MKRPPMKWSLLLFGLVAIAGTAAACQGLSPGDLLQTDVGLCTLGFLVADENGLYFTTAGHCIQVDQVATNPDVGEIGRGAFHFLEPETGSPDDGSPGMDFGLIRINPDAYPSLNPKMCGWEGPTGIYNDSPSGMVRLYGHSLVFGDLGALGLPTYAREGVLIDSTEEAFYFTAPSLMGDSGSAVLHEDGRAMGVLTHLYASAGTAPATGGGTTLARGFSLAAEGGFPNLRLVLMGEDPVAVLQEMRDAAGGSSAPTSGTTTTPPSNPPTTSPTKPTSPTKEPSSSSNSSSTEESDSIDPAAVDHSLAPENKQESPGAPIAIVIALAVALALALRRRSR